MKKIFLLTALLFQMIFAFGQTVGTILESKTIYNSSGITISYTIIYYGVGDCHNNTNGGLKKYRIDFSAKNNSISTVKLAGSRIDLDDNLDRYKYDCFSSEAILLGSYPGFEEFGTLASNEIVKATKYVYMLQNSNKLPSVTYNIIPIILPNNQNQSNSNSTQSNTATSNWSAWQKINSSSCDLGIEICTWREERMQFNYQLWFHYKVRNTSNKNIRFTLNLNKNGKKEFSQPHTLSPGGIQEFMHKMSGNYINGVSADNVINTVTNKSVCDDNSSGAPANSNNSNSNNQSIDQQIDNLMQERAKACECNNVNGVGTSLCGPSYTKEYYLRLVTGSQAQQLNAKKNAAYDIRNDIYNIKAAIGSNCNSAKTNNNTQQNDPTFDRNNTSFQDYYKRATAAGQAGNYDEAISLWNSAISVAVNDAQRDNARAWLAEAQKAKNANQANKNLQQQQALQRQQQLLKQQQQQQYNNTVNQANTNLQTGNYMGAMKSYADAVQNATTKGEKNLAATGAIASGALGIFDAIAKGKAEKRERELIERQQEERKRQKSTNILEENWETANNLAKQGDYRQATNIMLPYLNADKINAQSISLIGYWYSQSEDYINAKACFEKALKIDKKLCAMHYMGDLYQYGQAVKINYETALSYYKQSCENGDETGCKNYEKLKEIVEATNKNYLELAKNEGEKATEEGYKTAINLLVPHVGELGGDNLNSLGQYFWKLKDYQPALKYYKMAADKGNDWGYNNLRICYQNGYGVEANSINNKKAFEYGSKISVGFEGIGEVNHQLGHLCESGANNETSQPDYQSAFNYFIKGANINQPDCMLHLGEYYDSNGKMMVNLKLAKQWYDKACNAGQKNACDALKKLSENQKNDEVKITLKPFEQIPSNNITATQPSRPLPLKTTNGTNSLFGSETNFDFGKIENGQNQTHFFELLKNVKSAKADCGCISIETSPRQPKTIMATFHGIADYKGVFSKTIFVTYQDGTTKTLYLKGQLN